MTSNVFFFNSYKNLTPSVSHICKIKFLLNINPSEVTYILKEKVLALRYFAAVNFIIIAHYMNKWRINYGTV